MALVTKNCMFVHVPKTGGTWVRSAIRTAGLWAEESGPFDIHDHYGLLDLPACLVTKKFTFGYVRHPVTWLQSRWAWAIKTNFSEKMKVEPMAAGHWMADCWSESFDEFVSAYLDIHPGVATGTMLKMLGYGKCSEGWRPTEFKAHMICKYEMLVDDLITALRLGGEEFDYSSIMDLKNTRLNIGAAEMKSVCIVPMKMRRKICSVETHLMSMFDYDE